MWREPFARQALLQEGHTRGEVGEAVDPVRDVATDEDLRQLAREVVAVSVHQVVTVAAELLAQFFQNLVHVLRSKVGVTYDKRRRCHCDI